MEVLITTNFVLILQNGVDIEPLPYQCMFARNTENLPKN